MALIEIDDFPSEGNLHLWLAPSGPSTFFFVQQIQDAETVVRILVRNSEDIMGSDQSLTNYLAMDHYL